mgnify:CR=1 FL=1
MLARSEGQMVVLQVWSTKRKELRSAWLSFCRAGAGADADAGGADVQLVPSRSWSTTGSSAGTQPSLLGLSLRLCNPQHALDQVRGLGLKLGAMGADSFLLPGVARIGDPRRKSRSECW